MNSFIREEKVERGMRLKKKVTVRATEYHQGHLGNCLAATNFGPPMNEQEKSGLRAVMCFSGVALLTSVSSSGRGSRTLWPKLRSHMNSGKICGL